MGLPEDLADQESELASLPRPEPDAGLRGRVLAAVRGELRRTASSRRLVRGGFWSFAAAAAAAALFWANLSMGAANDTDWDFGPPREKTQLRAAAERIRGLVPELSEREALRHAVLLRAGAGLVMVPQVKGPAGRTELPGDF